MIKQIFIWLIVSFTIFFVPVFVATVLQSQQEHPWYVYLLLGLLSTVYLVKMYLIVYRFEVTIARDQDLEGRAWFEDHSRWWDLSDPDQHVEWIKSCTR